MRGLPSATALVVSFARAVTTDPTTGEPLDPIAPELLPPGVGLVARRLGRDAARGGLGSRALAAASLGLVAHMRFRTWAIDRVIEQAVRAGARQLVILGAGADARAHRMPALGAVPVFEVDHPATQAYRGQAEGAAGSLFYTAPVTIISGPRRIEGEVVLKRVNDVPGASAEQLRWHIESTSFDF